MSLKTIRRQLQFAFLWASIFGLLIILMFLQTEKDKFAFWLLIIPMGGYIIYGHMVSRKYKYLPEFSDTVYYLGFTFTLMALFGATIFEKLSADPEKTIAYFGMALMTTIIGLIYRNYHMQFTDLNEDAFEKAQEQIDKEMAKFQLIVEDLQTRLTNLVNNIEDISHVLTDSLPTKISTTIENVDSRLISSFSKLEEDMNEMDVIFNESFSKVHELYEDLNTKNSNILKNMVSTLAELSNNLNQSVRSIETSTNQTAQLTENLHTNMVFFTNKITGDTNEDGILNITVSSIKDSTDELKQLSSGIKNLNQSYNENLESLQKTSELIRKEVEQIEKIFNDVETHIVKKFS